MKILAIDLMELEKHEGDYGYNGGIGCDVRDGPCSCGAWHRPADKVKLPDGRWASKHNMIPGKVVAP